MKHLRQAAIFPSCLAFLLAACLAAPAAAQPAPQGQDATAAAATDDEPTRKERKQQAKEARIAEYLRKKEEKRARREFGVSSSGSERPAVAAAAAATPMGKSAPRTRGRGTHPRAGAPSPLPRSLARVQDSIRRTVLADDPTVVRYLDLIDAQGASAHQLAAFGNFVAENGRVEDALEYYGVALHLVRDDPVLWINAGTLHRQRGDLSTAASVFSRALSLDRNNALAHYNLGAVLDEMGNYDEAIEEYKIALTLDPTLGDAAYNPQAANNQRLLVVKLLLYKEQAGSLGLPLVQVPGGEIRESAPAPRR